MTGAAVSEPDAEPGPPALYFALDVYLCAALIRIAGVGLLPSDRWTLLALWSVAADHADAFKRPGRTSGGFRTVTIATRPAHLLKMLCVLRRRSRGGREEADYRGKDWAWIRESLHRLASVPVSLEYWAPVKHGASVRLEARRFSGSLITVDTPIEGRGEVRVTLNVCDGVLTKFFVLVSRRLFGVRPHLGDGETKLLLWLLRCHRGRVRRPGHRIDHRWDQRHPFASLVSAGVVRARPQRPGEVRERVCRWASALKGLGVIEALAVSDDAIDVRLSPDFFHVEDARE